MTLSLPAWAASRVKWSGSTTFVEDRGSVPVLNPGFTKMTADELALIEARIADAEHALSPRDGVVLVDIYDKEQDHNRLVPMTQEEAKFIFVTKMLMAKPTAATTEEGAAARGESYMIALDDVTAWALDLAIRGWYAGTTSDVEKSDFKWAPDSAVLRRAALDEMRPLTELHAKLIAVRDARPYEEIYG